MDLESHRRHHPRISHVIQTRASLTVLMSIAGIRCAHFTPTTHTHPEMHTLLDIKNYASQRQCVHKLRDCVTIASLQYVVLN